jgi:hypothetical protein
MTPRTFTAALVLMLTIAAAPALAADDAIVVTGQPAPSAAKIREAASRPALLPVLYASYAGLQAYDVYSTRQALSRGAREANPLMQGAAGNSAAMIALKAGVTVGTIVAAERMWKNNNKVGAIAVLVASNSVAAIVASRNASTLRQLR